MLEKKSPNIANIPDLKVVIQIFHTYLVQFLFVIQ